VTLLAASMELGCYNDNMTASNHLYAGAAVALTLQRPFTGMAIALVSHYVLDVLPHYGRKEAVIIDWFRYKTTWVVEGLNIIGVPLLIFLLWGQPWWVFAAAFLAILPDAVWVFRYFYYERYGMDASKYVVTRFHHWIQWGERPWGAFVEVPCFVLLAYILVKMVY
jgi:hypothetical protein